MPGIAVAVIGCGKLGTAVITGILAAQRGDRPNANGPDGPDPVITQLRLCVRNQAGAERLSKRLLDAGDISDVSDLNGAGIPIGGASSGSVVISVADDHVESIRKSDVVVLTCPPTQARPMLSAPGMRDALAGTLLISMLGGVTVSALESAVYEGLSYTNSTPEPCYVMQAISNVAAARGKSLTLIGERSSSPVILDSVFSTARNLLAQIGEVAVVEEASQMPAATALCASGIAFVTPFLEGAIDAAVASGIDRKEAVHMAARTIAGASELALSGEDPAVVRDKVTTPGGSTAKGLAILVEADVRGAVDRALRATASAHT